MAQIGDIYSVKMYYKGTKGPFKFRPVLIIEDEDSRICTIVEITTTEPEEPPKHYDQYKVFFEDWATSGLNEKSWAKCNKTNIHKVKRDRLRKRLGEASNQDLFNIITKIVG